MGIANGNRLRGKLAPHVGEPKKRRICIVCGKKFEIFSAWIRKSNSRGFCCSRKCADKWHSLRLRKPITRLDILIKFFEFILGCDNHGYPFNYFKIRPAIYRRDRGECQVCGNKGMVCHHIDYNRHNNNNRNLIILCNSCHSKTNHNRNYWQSYFTDNFQQLAC